MEAMSILGAWLACLIPFGILIRLVYAHEHASSQVDSVASTAWAFTEKRASLLRRQVQSLNQRKLSAVIWPTAVVQLAKAYPANEDCGFALHDALLEAGRPDEAEAFRLPDPSLLRSRVLNQILGESDE